ncbi:unnamed protein product [Arabis nemorensis]|uniref:RNase H type-1 domain-containing protein n=1 Tax=Arabis nemorensis TaxID=586526 RepID=A0A565BES4_9BRAS|nr:unnamed protein product [Arabis nemorensis]
MNRCFTDGAWREDGLAAGMGWRIESNRKIFVGQGSKVMDFVKSPLMAEALAIRFALNHALELGLETICIASDAYELIRVLNLGQNRTEIFEILHDIYKLSSQFLDVAFIFIPRETNLVADSLAKQYLHALSMVSEINPSV